MKELTYKAIMENKDEFDLFIFRDDIKAQIKEVQKIDTAGTQILMGLIKADKIVKSDLSEPIQKELTFLGV